MAGHINEAADIWARGCRLPEVREGDFLARSKGRGQPDELVWLGSRQTTKRKRGLRGTTTVADVDAAKLARMLPYK